MKKKIESAIQITSILAVVIAIVPSLLYAFKNTETLKLIILVLFLLLAIILILAMSRFLSKKIMLPITEVDLENPVIDENYDEISTLLHKITRQNRFVYFFCVNFTLLFSLSSLITHTLYGYASSKR